MSTPDRDEAERFLAALDPNAATFTFQTFDDAAQRRSSLARILHGSLAQHFETLQQLNAQGAGVFVTINETNGKGRAAENVTRVRAQFADLDGAPLEPVLQAKLAPHIVVESSPGRWHTYWLVDDAQRDDFKAIQKALSKRFDGDPAVNDLSRVMRLPGFFHHKGEPFQTRIESLSDAPAYQAAQFKLPQAAAEPDWDNSAAAPVEADHEVVAEYQALLNTIDPDIKYDAWFRVCCALHGVLGSDTGKRIAIEWSQRGQKYKQGEIDKKWKLIAAHDGYGFKRRAIINEWALAVEARMTEQEYADLQQSIVNIVANA